MHGKRSRNYSIPAAITLLVIAALLSAAARLVPGFAQWYSTSIYPVLQGSIGRLAGLLPFSAGEALCIILPALLIIDIAVTIRKHIKRGSSADDEPAAHPLSKILRHLFVAACILIFLYSANCGVNYYRNPFVDSEAYSGAEFTARDLDDFCEFTVQKLQSIYTDNKINYPDKAELAHDAVDAMKNLAQGQNTIGNTGDITALRGFYPRPKQLTVLSRFFSMMGVSGIYCPFTIEANINGEMVGMEKPFTACHELSHLKGFMNEGEANYIGWLACINSPEEAFNSSGWLMAWIYAGNSLYRTDPDRYYELREKLPEEAIRELDENTEFWATHENKAAEVQDRVNDAYLKSNGQEQGIRTYNQLTTLMLLWYTEIR